MKFKKTIYIRPPFDKRNPDPKKNCGIHGMELVFVLKGKKGATQFIFATGQYLKHVSDELYNSHSRYNPFKGMGFDIGYHSPIPMYQDQKSMSDKCEVLGGTCYYDGSSLAASDFEDEFLEGGEEAVWKRLEQEYNDRFSDAKTNK